MAPDILQTHHKPTSITVHFMYWFIALFAITQIPLYWVQYPDIQDLPSHLARVHILMHLPESETLQRYYTLRDWQFGTNLAMEVVVPILARWMDLLFAFKIFISLATLLMTTGAVALGRVVNGRFSYLLLGVLLFTQNFLFFYGLLNYIFGLGMAFWLLAAWVHARNRHSLYCWIGFSLSCIVVYFCHLSAFGVYAVGVFGYELGHARILGGLINQSTLKALLRSSMQFIPVISLHLLASTSSGNYVPPHFDGSWLQFLCAWIIYKAARLVASPTICFLEYVGSMTSIVFSSACLFLFYVGFREGVLKLAVPSRWMVGALAITWFFLPFAGFGGMMIDTRVIPAVGLLLWSGLKIREHSKLSPNLVLGLIVTAVVIISTLTTREYLSRDDEYRHVRSALTKIPEGSKVATVSLSEDGSWPISSHTGAWSVVDRSTFLSDLHAWPFLPVWVAYRAPYDALAGLARLEGAETAIAPAYENLKTVYDYVLIVSGSKTRRTEYAPNAKIIFDLPSFRLLQTKLDP